MSAKSQSLKTFSSQFARREEKLRPRVRAARVPDVGAGGVLGGPPGDRGQPDGGQAQEGQRGRAAAGLDNDDDDECIKLRTTLPSGLQCRQ